MQITELVVTQFVNENLQNVVDKGTQFYATCPYCGKQFNHFNVSKSTGKFHCFSCGASGTFEYLVRHVLGWNVNVKKIVEDYSGGISLATLLELYDNDVSMADMFFDWKAGTKELDCGSLLSKRAIQYLQSRNISLDYALELGIRLGVEGKYKNMLVIPIYSGSEVVNLVARRIEPYKGVRYSGPHKGEAPVAKADLLYNYDEAQQQSWVIIVEGIFDAIALKQENLPVVALLGKEMSSEQLLQVLNTWDIVYIMLDGGFLKDAIEIGKKLQGLTSVVRLCMLPEGNDASDDTEAAIASLNKSVSIENF